MRLREDAVFDESAFADLRAGLRRLSNEWSGQELVDKELAGWLVSTLLVVLGAKERFERNGATADAERLGFALMEFYELLDACFEWTSVEG